MHHTLKYALFKYEQLNINLFCREKLQFKILYIIVFVRGFLFAFNMVKYLSKGLNSIMALSNSHCLVVEVRNLLYILSHETPLVFKIVSHYHYYSLYLHLITKRKISHVQPDLFLLDLHRILFLKLAFKLSTRDRFRQFKRQLGKSDLQAVQGSK